jgi:hypothetical protein
MAMYLLGPSLKMLLTRASRRRLIPEISSGHLAPPSTTIAAMQQSSSDLASLHKCHAGSVLMMKPVCHTIWYAAAPLLYLGQLCCSSAGLRSCCAAAGGGGGGQGGGVAERGQLTDLINLLRKEDLLPVAFFTFSKKRCDAAADACSGLDLTTAAEKHTTHVFIQQVLARLKEGDRGLPQVGHTTAARPSLLIAAAADAGQAGSPATQLQMKLQQRESGSILLTCRLTPSAQLQGVYGLVVSQLLTFVSQALCSAL